MIPPDPIERFCNVYALAEKIDRAIIPEPNAMSLGTVDQDGQPSVRIVLLKSFDERGFVFYTNYEGRKGKHLIAQPRAAFDGEAYALRAPLTVITSVPYSPPPVTRSSSASEVVPSRSHRAPSTASVRTPALAHASRITGSPARS